MSQQQTTPQASALHLWQLGANITAIPEGKKAPVHKWNARGAQCGSERQPRAFLTSICWRNQEGCESSLRWALCLFTKLPSGAAARSTRKNLRSAWVSKKRRLRMAQH